MSPSEENEYNNSLEKFTNLTTALLDLTYEEKSKIIQIHELSQSHFPDNSLILSMITPFNINSLDKNQRTLLHKAVRNENYELAVILIKLGAYINTIDIFNKTPLISAIEFNYTQMANLLITNISNDLKYQFVQTNMFVFLDNTYLNAMHQIYYYLNNLNNEQISSSNTVIRRTKIPLHLAVAYSNIEIVYCLLKNGADPNEKDQIGLTALHRAATIKNLNIVKLLVRFKANPNTKSVRKILPLHWSCRWSDTQTISYLLTKTFKFNLNQLDDLKFTPLDRLWSRLNSFRYKTLEDKLEFDKSISEFQEIFKKAIYHYGCVLKSYKFDPFHVTNTYYMISNLLMLVETIFRFKSPSKDYFRSQQALSFFTTNTVKFLIEKLRTKYLLLVADKLNLNIDFGLYDLEFNDLIKEFKKLKFIIHLIVTSGQLSYEFSCSFTTYHLDAINRQLLNELFSEYLNGNDMNNIIDIFDLQTITKLKLTSVLELRQIFTSYLINYSFDYLKRPLSLQELCRIKVKNSLKLFNSEIIDNLNLTKTTKNYLFYN
jgi:ankyrin repeat protein